MGFLVIQDSESYRYPLAHIAPIRTPGSYSLPLLIGATVALHEYLQVKEALSELRNSLLHKLQAIEGVRVIGSSGESTRYLSFLVEDFSGEEVVRALLSSGISVDAGSACSPEDLAPSHVIAAMGLPTTGHLRATIHLETKQEDVNNLVNQLKIVLRNLRS
jgi:cysteine desulfurase